MPAAVRTFLPPCSSASVIRPSRSTSASALREASTSTGSVTRLNSTIPENSTAVGSPAQVVKRDGVRVDQLDQIDIPDPVAQEFEKLNKRIEELEAALAKLQPH